MSGMLTISKTFLCLVVLLIHATSGKGLSSTSQSKGQLLVIGATGTTGLRAIQGLMDAGYKPQQLRLLTRNANSEKCLALKNAGFEIAQADMEDLNSLRGQDLTTGCTGCYVHSTSSDIPELDKGEVPRAENLALVIGSEKNQIRHIVYNSAAAHEDHGVARITQKHDVENVFQNLVQTHNNKDDNGKLSFTALRCNIFMEELWKVYTRPTILKGRYPLPVRGKRKIYLISVRDLGKLAGSIIRNSGSNNPDEASSFTETINIAGDYLSAKEIAQAFGSAQGTPCEHYNPRLMTLKAWWKFPELYEQIRFIQTFTVQTDVEALKGRFPGMLTSFADFLEETQWGNKELSFSDFSNIANLKL
ncbi:NmrA-like family [Seminavis robusta]|uniref:NmrA-like family n=1 Tax=Seminavis robusta TaxID=568900 RepID=A0A9N8DHJ6_9STRA|nr:NmrA-like family [Seminavis robusta]|eukprot:Sro162_g072760.1 NmrA-like family (361) ;mRNA; f:19906-20988